MRMRILPTFAVILCTLTISARAQSTFTANLDGSQVVSPSGSPATGIGDFTLSGNNLIVTFGSYQGLLSGALNLTTINDAAIGANGPKVGSSLITDIPGTTTGTFSGTIGLTASQITDLQAGNFYVIIRSSTFFAGEIRGQLLANPNPVPEPATAALTGLGAAALLITRRRKA